MENTSKLILLFSMCLITTGSYLILQDASKLPSPDSMLRVIHNCGEEVKRKTSNISLNSHFEIDEIIGEKHAVSRYDIHLAVVACDRRLNQTMILLKSVLIFSLAKLHIHIFTENHIKKQFTENLHSLPEDIKRKFSYQFHDIEYPGVSLKKLNRWKRLFKPCATQRIFIPDLIQDVDHLVYVDTDVLFLTPVDEVWRLFSEFDSMQILGAAWHNENGAILSWKYPVYLPYGLNSGVLMMDLPRMRAANWTKNIMKYFDKYHKDLVYGDQALFDIFFYYHPEMLYKLNCRYNYRFGTCREKNADCKIAKTEGAAIIHGTADAFHLKPVFGTFAKYFHQFEFGQGLEDVYYNMTKDLSTIKVEQDKCIVHVTDMTRALERSIKRMSGISNLPLK